MKQLCVNHSRKIFSLSASDSQVTVILYSDLLVINLPSRKIIICSYEYSIGASQIPPKCFLLAASTMYLNVFPFDRALISFPCFNIE